MSEQEVYKPILEYRPDFGALPVWGDTDFDMRSLYQSFSMISDYQNISFEEQRLIDTGPPLSYVQDKCGFLAPKALAMLRVQPYASQSPTRKLPDLIRPVAPIVTIRVGTLDNVTDFAIHQNILVQCSPYFKAASKEAWANKEAGAVFSLDQDPAAFELYNEWVYSGRIILQDKDNNGRVFETLAKAYIIGDQLLDHKFKNAIVDSFIAQIIARGSLDLTLPKLIYENTTSSSPFRKLLVNLYLFYGHKEWMTHESIAGYADAPFLLDISAASIELCNQVQFTEGKQLPSLAPCVYHEHPNGKRCVDGIIPAHPREIAAPVVQFLTPSG